MNNNMQNRIFGFIFGSAIFIALGYIYYVGYVIPRDEALGAIMDCQLELNDMSYEGYEYCLTKLSKQGQ